MADHLPLLKRAPVFDPIERWVGVPVRVPWSAGVGVVTRENNPDDRDDLLGLDLRVAYFSELGEPMESAFLASMVTRLEASTLTNAEEHAALFLWAWAEVFFLETKPLEELPGWFTVLSKAIREERAERESADG